jgi:hypothetical protein
MSPKFAGLGWNTLLSEHLGKQVYQGAGDIRVGGVDKGWTAALAGVREKRELGDYDGTPACALQREIHFALVVFEDAQVDDLINQGLCLAGTIALSHPKQDDQAWPDLGNDPAFHRNPSMRNPLEDGSHQLYHLTIKKRSKRSALWGNFH